MTQSSDKVVTFDPHDRRPDRANALEPEFVGFTIGDHFIVGYGIDFAEEFRDLPYLAKLDQATPR